MYPEPTIKENAAVDRNRPNHEPVVVALFPYASDARRALLALREQGFTSDQVAAAFRDQESPAAEVDAAQTRTESSKWFGQLRQMYHGDEEPQVRRAEAARFSDKPTAGFEAMLAQLALSPEDAVALNSNLDQGAAIVTVQAGPRNQEARLLLEKRGARIAHGGSNAHTQYAAPSHDLRPASTQGPSETIIRSLPFTAPPAAEPGHIQLFGEVLNVHKEKISSDVQVRKERVTRMETVQVPVTREELVVERPDSSGLLNAENAIRLPLNEERVHIDKDTVLREEYKVGKREVTQNRSITDNVRRERLLIDDADAPTNE